MKVLASDFDGTLFFKDETPTIRKKDIEAIKKFQAAGNKFGICTGRHLRGILDVTKNKIDFDFYILNSGCIILDHDCNPIYERWIDYSDAIQVFEKYPDESITVVGKNQYIYAYKMNSLWKSNMLKEIESFDQIDDQQIIGFSLHVDSEQKARKITHDINIMDLPIIAYQNRSDVDCIYRECSKGTGIDKIKEYYVVEDQEMCCIGDNYNDIPMLEASPNSFTFNNSPEELRKIVPYTVDSLCECIDQIME